MTPVRFGLVGAGAIAHSYVQAFASCEAARLVAVADVRAEAARALAEGVPCRSYASAEALAADPEVEAVLLCTPPSTHRALSMHCVERGRHVLCEKPLALDVEGARVMLDAARRAGVLLTMATKFRYVEDVVRAKSIVTSGILGTVVLFENTFASRVDMGARWNSDPAVSGGGVLIDNGTHSVDLMRYFLGRLTEVHCVEGRRVQGLAVEDTARIFVRSADGVMGSIDLSWSIDKEAGAYLAIYGSHGTVLVGWRESKYRQTSSRDWVVFGHGYDKLRALGNQLTNFAGAIRGVEPLRVTPEDALASVEVIEAAYASLRDSHWTRVPWDVPASAPAAVGAS